MTVETIDPRSIFHSPHYLRHNQRRLEHLATLRLDLDNRSVLEVGAGIGDHTSFFIDRDCRVTVTEARDSNLALIKERFPSLDVCALDLDTVDEWRDTAFEIVYCYGLLYHLRHPQRALRFMAKHCSGLLLLETCVSFKENNSVNEQSENISDPSQSHCGTGCRPSRGWVFDRLKESFPFVYMPISQPWHEEFPLDWNAPTPPRNLNSLWRSIFIGSRKALSNTELTDTIPMVQVRR